MLRTALSVILITLVGTISFPGSTTSGAARVQEQQSTTSRPYAPGELIVKIRDDAGARLPDPEFRSRARFESLSRGLGCVASEDMFQSARAPGSKIDSGLGLDRVRILKFDAEADLEPIVQKIRASGLVEYAERNYYVTVGSDDEEPAPDPTPNDPGFGEQWGLRNPGLSVGGFPALLNADIKALAAWTTTTGTSDLVIAVSDTGVDITHPDLAPNIYTNLGEIEGNGRDDDGNGYIDDVHGYNVAESSSDVSDVMGHGTQIAGIIAGVRNNEIGISGLTKSKIMPVKFYKRTGSRPADVQGTVADAARSIIYAVSAGATIINASWSTTVSNPPPEGVLQSLQDAVKAANEAGVLFVCIAGNFGVNIDFQPIYPAGYLLPNQIVVGASDFTDSMWHQYGAPTNLRTNFGTRTVHLAAPGELIYTTSSRGDCPLCSTSTDPDDWYAFIDGTSASAAFVSGVAALVKSIHPDDNVFLLRRRLIESVDERDNLRPYVATSGRLNAASAVAIQLTASQPTLNKVKYKVGAEKMILFGEGIADGAHVMVGNRIYPTRIKGGQLIANVPIGHVPIDKPVSIRMLNPDGGTSFIYVLTR